MVVHDSSSLLCGAVGRADRALQRLLNGASDSDFRVAELRSILLRLGFREHTRGSHKVFRHATGAKIVLATHRPEVPAYQVREVRRILGHYGLTETHDA